METPEPIVSRKGRILAKLEPDLNPVTCPIHLQMLVLKDMVLLSVKLEDGVGVGYYKLRDGPAKVSPALPAWARASPPSQRRI